MPKPTKYKSKFAKQLREGLRLDGRTIAECCVEWGITRSVWYQWIDKIPEFAEAVEMSELHSEAYLAKIYRNVMEGKESGNAGMLINAAKYVLGWDGKPEVAKEEVQDIRVLNIQIMDSRPQLQLIENNVIDIKAIEHVE